MNDSQTSFAESSNLFDLDEATPIDWPCSRPAVLISHERKALRDRFSKGGPTSLPDHEVLELILFRALPRQDVRPLAKELLETFGDFNRVVTAPADRLERLSGLTKSVVLELKLIEAAAHRLARSKIMHRHVLSSWQTLLDYCHTAMSHNETEQFRVLFLDRKNVLIADEEQAKGTVDHVPVYPREVAKRALELNASAIILVHNHPSGDPTPSQSDITMTQKIQLACDALGLTLHDHLIIGKSSELSFRSEGLI
jgi:DNA repair protein RadC